MPGGMWFVVCVPKKDHELRDGKTFVPSVSSVASSKESLSKSGLPDGELSSLPHGGRKTPEAEAVSGPSSGKDSQTSLNKSNSSYSDMVYFAEKRGPLEDMLKDALSLLGIVDAVWCSEKNDKFFQVYWPCDSGSKCDHILRTLAVRGIGFVADSTVAVLPCAVFYHEGEVLSEDDTDSSDNEGDTPGETKDTTNKESVKSKTDTKNKSMKGFKAMQQEFLKSVTARLTVAQVVDSVRAGSALTFDFIMFVCLASLIAAFGLMDSNPVNIVASMLVSPIMGPIVAGTFGCVIRDKSLLMLGLKAEGIGLSLAFTIGLSLGLITGNFSDQWGPYPFPTPEMAGRGQGRSLWMGVLIALPSGAGVALSILGGNAGSLVGVAISASLLPPTVNCGILWGLAIVKRLYSYSYEVKRILIKDQYYNINEALAPPPDYEPIYRMEMDKECAILGMISFLLTCVNICCIIIAAVLVLKIKEVAPNTSLQTTKRFWKQDLKIARDYNKTINHQEASEMGQNFLSEWAACTDNFHRQQNLNGLNPSEVLQDSKTQYQTLQDMLNDVEDDDVYRSILSYVPQAQNMSKRVTLAALPFRQEERRVSDIEGGGFSGSPVKKAINKRRHTRFNDTLEFSNTPVRQDSTPATDDTEFSGVRLRHASVSGGGGRPGVNSVLRRSLQTAASPPYSLWPSQNKLRRLNSSRFIVTPVEDPLPPLPPRQRVLTGIQNRETKLTDIRDV